MEIRYLLKKIKNSWISGTLREKITVYLANQLKRYLIIPCKSLIQSTDKQKLNFIDGYKDQRLKKDFLEIQPDQIIRIIKAYKLAKLDQKNASP